MTDQGHGNERALLALGRLMIGDVRDQQRLGRTVGTVTWTIEGADGQDLGEHAVKLDFAAASRVFQRGFAASLMDPALPPRSRGLSIVDPPALDVERQDLDLWQRLNQVTPTSGATLVIVPVGEQGRELFLVERW